jgi:hypothetical protein
MTHPEQDESERGTARLTREWQEFTRLPQWKAIVASLAERRADHAEAILRKDTPEKESDFLRGQAAEIDHLLALPRYLSDDDEHRRNNPDQEDQ